MSPSPAVRRSAFTQNIRWAFGWTFSFATAYSGYVLLVTLARRATWFESYQMSTWTIILGYYIAALLAGVALAVLRPWGNSRIGAYCLGAVIGFLVYGSIGVMMEGLKAVTFWMAAILSLFTGGLGIVVRDEGFAGWSQAGNDLASLSRGKMALYGLSLAGALILLWLDLRYHVINR
jgi:hypothetical protein